jgi:cytochrome c-type biogenesis protein CcmH
MRKLLLILCLIASPVFALDPSEMLSDPALEARARVLDHEIRCVKCQSEAVASSNADWARDARRMIRELIADGKSNDEVLEWFHDRYGDFVLMTPPRRGTTLLLWWAGPLLLLGGLGLGWMTVRSRGRSANAEDLSEDEEKRLAKLLDDSP